MAHNDRNSSLSHNVRSHQEAQMLNNMAQGSNDYNNVHSQAHMSNGHIR